MNPELLPPALSLDPGPSAAPGRSAVPGRSSAGRSAPGPYRRVRVALSGAVAALLLSAGGLALADTVGAAAAPAHSAVTASPNFFCIALGSFGLCVGPPTV